MAIPRGERVTRPQFSVGFHIEDMDDAAAFIIVAPEFARPSWIQHEQRKYKGGRWSKLSKDTGGIPIFVHTIRGDHTLVYVNDDEPKEFSRK